MKGILFLVAFACSLLNARGCWVLDEVDAKEEADFPVPAEIAIETYSLSGVPDTKAVIAKVRIQISKDLLYSGRFGHVRSVLVKRYTEGSEVVREEVETSQEIPLREAVLEFTTSVFDLRRYRLCIESLDVEKFLPCSGGTFIYRLEGKEANQPPQPTTDSSAVSRG